MKRMLVEIRLARSLACWTLSAKGSKEKAPL